MNFIGKILKSLLFAAAILLIGQVELGRKTLAEHFHEHVLQFWKWGKQELTSRLSLNSAIKRGQKIAESSSQDRSKDLNDIPKSGTELTETISSSDRDSILSLINSN